MREYTITFENNEKETVNAECMTLNQGICFSDSEEHMRLGLYTAIFLDIDGMPIIKVTSEPCED